jgi:2-oxoglutarate dehydrogenase E1 component
MKTTFRKPLVVFSQKSLLRHPYVSTVSDLANGEFKMIDDISVDRKSKTLVFVTGKFYCMIFWPK